MQLNQECIMLQSELRKFAQQVILDKVDELEKSCSVPVDNIKQLAEMGILGSVIPEEFNGAALELLGLIVSLEEISKVCASTATIVGVHNAMFAYPILKFGSDEMKKKYLPAAAQGETIGAFACLGTNQVEVAKQDSNFIINGTNELLLNGEFNGPFITCVPAPDETTPMLALVVEPNSQVQIEKSNSVLGLKSAGIARITYNNYTIPESSIIGKKEQGTEILNATHDFAVICLAATLVGIAEAAMDESIKYAKERVQFDEKIINYGMVREKIALMATQIEATRQLVYNAAMLYDAGKKFQHMAAMAKYLAGEVAVETTIQTIQVFGGYGYMKDYPVERLFRDAHVLNVIGSRPDMEKERIAKDIIG
jgi:alkylation response protein AidB-like acyl-CoA dehydrogenase